VPALAAPVLGLGGFAALAWVAFKVGTLSYGGGFGTKGWQYVDHRLVLWAAKKLDRPVKWRCERSEVIMADEHGRDNVGEIELGLDENYKFLCVRLNM